MTLTLLNGQNVQGATDKAGRSHERSRLSRFRGAAPRDEVRFGPGLTQGRESLLKLTSFNLVISRAEELITTLEKI